MLKTKREAVSSLCIYILLICQVSRVGERFPQLALVPRSPHGYALYRLFAELHPSISAVICPPPVGGVRDTRCRNERNAAELCRDQQCAACPQRKMGFEVLLHRASPTVMLLPMLLWRNLMQRAACTGKGKKSRDLCTRV